MKKIIIVFLLLSCLLAGCSQQNNMSKVRVITGITVTATDSEGTFARTYTQGRKMSRVMNYLRLLDPYISVPLSPDTFRTDSYEITVNYSDGEHTRYHQIYHDYFQTEGGVWKQIDPKQGARLQQIIEELDTDI